MTTAKEREVESQITISRLLRLRRKAHRAWTLRSHAMLAWQDEHGLAATLTSPEWYALCKKVRHAEARMLRLRRKAFAAGWKPPPRPNR